MEKRCADRHMDQSDHSWLSGHASVRSGTQGLRGTRRAMLLLLMLLPALHAVGTGHLPYTGTHAGTRIWSTGAEPKLDWSGRTRFHARRLFCQVLRCRGGDPDSGANSQVEAPTEEEAAGHEDANPADQAPTDDDLKPASTGRGGSRGRSGSRGRGGGRTASRGRGKSRGASRGSQEVHEEPSADRNAAPDVHVESAKLDDASDSRSGRIDGDNDPPPPPVKDDSREPSPWAEASRDREPPPGPPGEDEDVDGYAYGDADRRVRGRDSGRRGEDSFPGYRRGEGANRHSLREEEDYSPVDSAARGVGSGTDYRNQDARAHPYPRDSARQDYDRGPYEGVAYRDEVGYMEDRRPPLYADEPPRGAREGGEWGGHQPGRGYMYSRDSARDLDGRDWNGMRGRGYTKDLGGPDAFDRYSPDGRGASRSRRGASASYGRRGSPPRGRDDLRDRDLSGMDQRSRPPPLARDGRYYRNDDDYYTHNAYDDRDRGPFMGAGGGRGGDYMAHQGFADRGGPPSSDGHWRYAGYAGPEDHYNAGSGRMTSIPRGDPRYPDPRVGDRVSLLVRNLSKFTSRNSIRRIFGRFGELSDVYVPRDYHTRRPKSYAFLEYVHYDSAKAALRHMDGETVDGRTLTVCFAQMSRKSVREMQERRFGPGPGTGAALGKRRMDAPPQSREWRFPREESRFGFDEGGDGGGGGRGDRDERWPQGRVRMREMDGRDRVHTRDVPSERSGLERERGSEYGGEEEEGYYREERGGPRDVGVGGSPAKGGVGEREDGYKIQRSSQQESHEQGVGREGGREGGLSVEEQLRRDYSAEVEAGNVPAMDDRWEGDAGGEDGHKMQRSSQQGGAGGEDGAGKEEESGDGQQGRSD